MQHYHVWCKDHEHVDACHDQDQAFRLAEEHERECDAEVSVYNETHVWESDGQNQRRRW